MADLRRAVRRSPSRIWLVGAGLYLVGMVAVVVRAHASRVPGAQDGNDVRTLITSDADSLDASVVALSRAIASGTGDSLSSQRVRSAFRLTRARYKHLEGIVEYYAPALAAALNSRRQEVDDDDAPPPSSISASGFPALEQVLWPVMSRAHADSAGRLADAMHSPVARVRALAAAITPTDAQVIEIARLELARISTLGISGFDAPQSGEAMRECAEALTGVRSLIAAVGAVGAGRGSNRNAPRSTPRSRLRQDTCALTPISKRPTG